MMNQELLKEILSIPSRSGDESRMIEWLKAWFLKNDIAFREDRLGNLYATKGEAEEYPCFVSHTDTVHKVNENLEVYLNQDGHLQGRDFMNHQPLGIGGDDKCGVYLCIEMLQQLDNVKAAFFVGEEVGMVGSKKACPEFFSNVKYAIQFDSPEGDTMSWTLLGKPLFDKESPFGLTVSPLIKEAGITKWQNHPFTDIYQLLVKFDFPCLNLAAGYHNYHRAEEYVVIAEVENTLKLAQRIHAALLELEPAAP